MAWRTAQEPESVTYIPGIMYMVRGVTRRWVLTRSHYRNQSRYVVGLGPGPVRTARATKLVVLLHWLRELPGFPVCLVLTIHVRPTVTPHKYNENPPKCVTPKEDTQNRRKSGETEGDCKHDRQSRLSHRWLGLCRSLLYPHGVFL